MGTDKPNYFNILKNGIINENPSLIQVLGICPTLAVTTSAINGMSMGLATTLVLICSNAAISFIRKLVPDKVRIPVYVVVVAAFVSVVQIMLTAYLPELNNSLGVFIPLIVVNCIILARAESYASKNGVLASGLDGFAMGMGFCLILALMGIIREILGVGTVFGYTLLADWFPKTLIIVFPPGAFFTLAFLMAGFNYLKLRKMARKKSG